METMLEHRVLLVVMTTFFAVLALDIAVPATVLVLMGFGRWLMLHDWGREQVYGRAA